MPRVSSALVDVWKDRALAAEARERDLIKHLMELKAKGAYVPTPGRVVPPPPSAESLALQRVEEGIVEELTKTIVQAKGVPLADARAEAERIRSIGMATFAEQMV